LAPQLSESFWSNETPTGSGLAPDGFQEPGGLDLAHWIPHGERVWMIEFKINSDNPVSAAFQLVGYALVLNLARIIHSRLIPPRGEERIQIAEKWMSARHADLYVLAPRAFYGRHPRLDSFEQQLDKAAQELSEASDLKMRFAFRYFEAEAPPTDEGAMIKAIQHGRVVP